jgi:membrane associated rhomboid family serine protease
LFIKAAITVNDHSDAVFYSQVVNWFHVPAGLTSLSERPWTIVSYMFSDVELFRIFSNMLWLWAFGSIFQNLTGNKKLIPVYLYGGFAGALFFILAAHAIPSNRLILNSAGLLGANTGVLAVAVAATVIAPNYRIFRHIRSGIPVWVLTVIYIAVDLAGVAALPGAYPVAHLGAVLAGFLFVKGLQYNIDGSVWMNNLYYRIANLFNPQKKRPRNTIKEKVFYNTGSRTPYHKTANVTQQRVDEILDKINQRGYNYLTKEEKEILKRASED